MQRNVIRYLISISVFLCFLTLFSATQPTYATCKCIATSSATLNNSQGAWRTINDGGAACDTDGKFREGAKCNALTESYINVWFCIPTLGDLIGNLIRIIFFIAGLMALFMLLLGAFEWVASGGDEKKLQSARTRIISAVVGLVVMVAVMTLVILIEQIIFGGKVCLGISCPLNVGKLAIIENNSPGGRASCFGPASSSATLAPSGRASGSASLSTIPVKKVSPIVVTATPKASQFTGRIASPSAVPSGIRVIILPYGTGSNTPTPGLWLPGTGGGAGKWYPRPTVPPLE